MDKPLHVLVVDDSGDDALLLMRELGRGGYATTFERVDTPELMAAALDKQDWDVVIIDYAMPHFSAADALALLQERNIDWPFLVVSGAIGEEAAVAIMKGGAHDFLVKDNLVRLVPAIERELHEAKERRALQRAEKGLLESEDRYRALFENASDGILLRDLSGNIIMANQAVANLSGYTVGELAKMNISQFLSSDGFEVAMQRQKSQVKDGKQAVSQRYEVQMIRSDGTRRIIESVTSLLTSGGELSAIQAIVRDVTEQRRAHDNMRTYAGQVTKAQEDERKRIARELHDETVQYLARMGLDIDSLLRGDQGFSEELVCSLEELRSRTIEILNGVRRFSQELRPPMLDELGLEEALRWLTHDLSSSSAICADIDVVGGYRRLSSEMELALFRIAQETLTNARKHSQATHVMVRLIFGLREIELTIIDNGCGFDLPDVISDFADSGRLGLIGMRERAKLLNGTVSVRSVLGEGTIVVVWFSCDDAITNE